MAKLALSLMAAAMLGSVGYMANAETDAATVTAAPAQMSAEQIVSARRAGMMLSGSNMGAIKGAIDRAEDPKTMTFAANALVAWSKALPGLFPAGSQTAQSKAKAEIWSDRAGFDGVAKSFTDDALLLRDYAKAGDAASFATQWTKLRSNCAACHDKYKSE